MVRVSVLNDALVSIQDLDAECKGEMDGNIDGVWSRA